MEENITAKLFSFLKQNFIVIAISGIGLMCLCIGLIAFLDKPKEEIQFESVVKDRTDGATSSIESSTIFVDVSGEVERPGLYQLPVSARIADAITKAGGMTENADQQYVSQTVNLAQKLEDGGKVYVASKNKTINKEETTGSGESSYHSTSSTVNINNASSQELDELPGIGTVRAQKIIDNRPYSEKKDLVAKKVVTQKIFEEIEALISIY